MISNNEFVLKVYHWGNDRKINQNSTAFAQTCKMKAEAGELADADKKAKRSGIYIGCMAPAGVFIKD